MLTEEKELKKLKIIFFLFGLSIMSWVPRFPDVKNHLGLSNGEFGSLISIGAIGNALSLLTVGHLVHKYGAKLMMQVSAFTLADFEAMLLPHQLKIKNVFGDYQLNSFDANNSPRLIFVAEKTA